MMASRPKSPIIYYSKNDKIVEDSSLKVTLDFCMIAKQFPSMKVELKLLNQRQYDIVDYKTNRKKKETFIDG